MMQDGEQRTTDISTAKNIIALHVAAASVSGECVCAWMSLRYGVKDAG